MAGRDKGSNSGVGGSRVEQPTTTATLADLGLDRKTAAVPELSLSRQKAAYFTYLA
jgi:hypothetical protein